MSEEILKEATTIGQEVINQAPTVTESAINFITGGSTPSIIVIGTLLLTYIIVSQLTEQYLQNRLGFGMVSSKVLSLTWPLAWLAHGTVSTGTRTYLMWVWREGVKHRKIYKTKEGEHMDCVEKVEWEENFDVETGYGQHLYTIFRRGVGSLEKKVTAQEFIDTHKPTIYHEDPSAWRPCLHRLITIIGPSNTEPDLKAIEANTPYASALCVGEALKQPASKEDMDSLSKRVTTLEGGVAKPGIIDAVEKGSVLKGYRGHQGDYVEIGGILALKKKDGTWSPCARSDNYWPDSMYDTLPNNFAWKLYQEAVELGILEEDLL